RYGPRSETPCRRNRRCDRSRRPAPHAGPPPEAERAVLERVDHAFLDRRDIIARHHAAGDLVFEREARAARHRLDVEHDIAVLAVAAGLFLVAAALLHALANGLAVTDRRLAPLDGDAVTVGEPLCGD